MKKHSLGLVEIILAISTIISFIFWIIYSLTKEPVTFIVYFLIWILLFGGYFYLNRQGLTSLLNASPGTKQVILALALYAMIWLEEIFAAFANHLSESFSLPTLLQRILQFQFFNLLAFTGFILGWVILSHKYSYTPKEVFYLSGCWGIWSESLWKSLFTNPLAFLLMVPLIIVTYGIISFPIIALATKKEPWNGSKKTLPSLLIKIPLTYGVLFLLSLPTALIIQWIFAHYPSLFPPSHFLGH